MSAREAKARKDSPFWRFSVDFYSVPQVAAACLALQDEAGADVNIVMFLLWHASRKRTFSPTDAADLERRIGDWRNHIVAPLRTVRRVLKSPPALIDPDAAEKFRTKVKGIELEAEKIQQAALYALAPALTLTEADSPLEAARASLAAYETLCPKLFPRKAVETLLTEFAATAR
jgi:uncharacterized protein (TIGR02444 family)